MLKGIDISKWQDKTPSLAGLSFIVLRASVGASKDTMWDTHYANARKAGLITMAYHYGMPASSVPIADQVAKFLEVAKNADFLWLDQEETGFTDAQAQDFINRVRAAGRPCGLYHSSSGFGGVNADAQWVADWRDASVKAGYPRTVGTTPKEFPGWDLWQYNGAGDDGIDNDYWNPDTTVASLMRVGYLTKAQSDKAVADAVAAATAAQQAELKSLRDQVVTLQAQNTALNAEVEKANTQLKTAQAELSKWENYRAVTRERLGV